jgi:N-formylglutamate deformylase
MSDNPVFTLHRGHVPLLFSVPHVGTHIPADIAHRLVPRALHTEDADWHLERLYAFAADIGASLIVPRHARYVVDLNRPPENTPMYPGANNTELCPTRFFTGEPLYRARQEPGDEEVQDRVARYWRPYHETLLTEMQHLHAEHGRAILFDGHSIQARLPWLFDGCLHDLNLGTAEGKSCSPALRTAMEQVLGQQSTHSFVIDGRFKGGYITRHYGRPTQGFHAVQMEMCWHCYMRQGDAQDAAALPAAYDAGRAAQVQPVLRALAQALLDTAP